MGTHARHMTGSYTFSCSCPACPPGQQWLLLPPCQALSSLLFYVDCSHRVSADLSCARSTACHMTDLLSLVTRLCIVQEPACHREPTAAAERMPRERSEEKETGEGREVAEPRNDVARLEVEGGLRMELTGLGDRGAGQARRRDACTLLASSSTTSYTLIICQPSQRRRGGMKSGMKPFFSS